MPTIELSEKFIGFIDILGYSELTKAAEAGRGLNLDDLPKILGLLGKPEDRGRYEQYGPKFCPAAPRNEKHLDFRVTQAWDSVVVSAEISPAGVINLIGHCWGACLELLQRGLMCRGYISRGKIFHDADHLLGSGHTDTVAKERSVSIFQRSADERGTPFIEVDAEVIAYIGEQKDACVKEMFSRMVISDKSLTALFPIKRLTHKFIIGGVGVPPFDAQKEKSQNNILRETIKDIKEKVIANIDNKNESAVRKSEHYIRALDEQLRACDRTDAVIDSLCRPFPYRKYTRDEFPTLR